MEEEEDEEEEEEKEKKEEEKEKKEEERTRCAEDFRSLRSQRRSDAEIMSSEKRKINYLKIVVP